MPGVPFSRVYNRSAMSGVAFERSTTITTSRIAPRSACESWAQKVNERLKYASHTDAASRRWSRAGLWARPGSRGAGEQYRFEWARNDLNGRIAKSVREWRPPGIPRYGR